MNYITKYILNYIIEFMNQMINKIYPPSKKKLYKASTLYLNPLLSKVYKQYRPLYYANFLTSFDGRIATYDKKNSCLLTPQSIKSSVDFSLFCQLHAQSDCLVTNTQYIKGLNKGYYGNILTVNNDTLKRWRNKNGIKKQEIIILSNSLDFPINNKILDLKDRITILTTSKNNKKINNFKKNGFKLTKFRGKNISANQLNKYILKNNFKAVYFIAGPTIVEQMINSNLLDKLYSSTSISMMGTQKYDTIIRGNFLRNPIDIELIEMYIYTEHVKRRQTLFQVFNTKRK